MTMHVIKPAFKLIGVYGASAQVAKAAEEEMQDTMLYDGDQQRYLQLLANGGEEEVGIDASDVDSSDVASSNDIDSSDDDSDHGARDKLSSSVARAASSGKRGRAAIGASDPNPLMAEIGSKTERRQAAAQRWFNDPLFAGVDESLAAAEEEGQEADGGVDAEGGRTEVDDETASAPPAKRKRRKEGKEKGEKERGAEGGREMGAAEALLASMPKSDKEKRKEKRKKVGGLCDSYIQLIFPSNVDRSHIMFWIHREGSRGMSCRYLCAEVPHGLVGEEQVDDAPLYCRRCERTQGKLDSCYSSRTPYSNGDGHTFTTTYTPSAASFVLLASIT